MWCADMVIASWLIYSMALAALLPGLSDACQAQSSLHRNEADKFIDVIRCNILLWVTKNTMNPFNAASIKSGVFTTSNWRPFNLATGRRVIELRYRHVQSIY